MSIVVTVRTVTGKSAELSVDPSITIGDLQQRISDECGLGYASTLVYKATPLKNTTVTLESIGYKQGESLIGVFKKQAPKPAQEAAAASTPTPTPAASTESSTPAQQQQQQEPAPALAPAAEPKPDLKEWECVMCTYINIPARTICEMCESPNPNRPYRAPQRSLNSPEGRAPVDMNIFEGVDTSGMDEDTLMAIQSAMAEDMEDGGYGDHDGMALPIEDMLETIRTNDDARRALCTELNISEDSSIDDIREALTRHEAENGISSHLDPDQIVEHLLNDPSILAQLQETLPQDIGTDPETLRNIIVQLLNSGQLTALDDDEDDEDDDDDDGFTGMGDQW